MSAAFVVPGPRRRASERFSFRLPGESRNRSLPLMQDLRGDHGHRLAALARAAADLPEGEEGRADRARIALDEALLTQDIMEAEEPGILALLTGSQIRALVEAWREASNISVGESSAS